METVTESSRLCQDVCELEKDFKYNLMLLKIREEEIQRCETQNEKLTNELKIKEREQTDMQLKMQELEKNLHLANKEKVDLKINFEQTITRLTISLDELQKIHEKAKRQFVKGVQKKEIEFNRTCMSLMQGKDKLRRKEVAKLQDQLEMEQFTSHQIKTQLHNTINDNHNLRSEMQKQHSENIFKLSIYESEINSLRETETNLENEYKNALNDCDYLKSELNREQTEKNRLEQELSKTEETNKELKRKLNEISNEKDNLYKQLKTEALGLETCKESLEKVEDEKVQLKAELECLKQGNEESNCRDPEHKNINNVLQQNAILQEVVKSMRQERSNNFDIQGIECKIEQLEELVDELRRNLITKTTSD